MMYNLSIASTSKPLWYDLNLKISDEFTIINKKYDNFNQLDIKTNTNATIDGVTIIKRKEENGFFDNFSIGPSISLGYDVGERKPDIVVGLSITYDLKDLIWKK